MSSTFTDQVPSGEAVTVRVIDSTTRITNFPVKHLMGPDLTGFDVFPDLPTWSFLVEHRSGRKLLFDLGVPTDWRDLAPNVSNRLKSNGWDINVEKPTIDILREQNILPGDIEAIVWSHWHWDHIGNPNTFPTDTRLIVGPGFRDEKLPAYPANAQADVRQSDFEGRELMEIGFDEEQALTIGQFRAYDYFGDGSFYLLDTPGHAVGHLAGLARTTNSPSTFILMGGDLTHHAGEIRPSPGLPIPSSIPVDDIPTLAARLSCGSSCPGAIFESMQETRGRKPASTTPFFEPAMGKDIPLAIKTIEKTQIADADENILYIFAHDSKIRGVVDLFPSSANNWKQKGWRQKLLWRFLEDFEVAAQQQKETMEKEGTKL
ncbi:hypothetical protein LTS08_001664 [Lithohypha guttulata]|uniref:uncharacterized protein n=1 Tax=Lithohypha guttulata TaxID=1690604 RepID=UPI002DDF0979|nr:hypothetical protein LTR51_003652 [Lithohypha guttulata]KAK5105387.1 hypothetical protein LTS08_001664 [Lithohypha guttulata]